jgi:diadenosine tetraphosphatase ApaH/serine/threonine PP2A family protein phosphatase
MKWIISDIHGCMKTLLALMDKIETQDKNPEYIFVGDFVDRGPRSAEVVEFILEGVKSREFKAVKGNHESLMYLYFQSKFGSNWTAGNGGLQTIRSYRDYYSEMDDNEIEMKMEEDAELLCSLPLYLIFDKEDKNGRKLLISHAPCSDYIDDYLQIYGPNAAPNASEKYEEEHGLFARCQITKMADLFDWNRQLPVNKSEKYFNITGHNITGHLLERKGTIQGYNPETEVIIDNDKGYACIDTGAFVTSEYNVEYGGKMTAISFPNKEIIQQENIED